MSRFYTIPFENQQEIARNAMLYYKTPDYQWKFLASLPTPWIFSEKQKSEFDAWDRDVFLDRIDMCKTTNELISFLSSPANPELLDLVLSTL